MRLSLLACLMSDILKPRTMANAKYLRITDTFKVICKLKKNQRYYFEVAYAEKDDDDDDYESVWVGKRSIVIKNEVR